MSEITSKTIDDVILVGFASEKLLDEPVIQQVGEELLATASDAEAGQKLLLSFENVEFMSSSMLGKLILFLRTCKENGVQLKVCGIAPDILEVFKITKLNKLFDIQKDEERALESFSQKGWFD